MKALLFLLGLACAAAAAPAASSAPSEGADRRYYLGVGAGFEGANGVRAGVGWGDHGLEAGGGLTYSGANGHMNYSYGARYLYTLYEGAYAWTGAGKTGHIRDGHRGRLVSGAMGLGISIHVGSMFRLKLDSGWRLFADSGEGDGMLQVGPTFNGAFVYEW